MKIQTVTIMALMLAGMTLTGCDPDTLERWDNFTKTGKTRFLDASKVIAKGEQPEVGIILSSMTDLDAKSDLYPNAVRPTPADWTYADFDYRIGPSDLLDISILDLYAEGMETTLRKEVSDSGYIDLPQLRDRIMADGLTEAELKRTISKAYVDAGILRDPVVSVSVIARRQQTFSALGAVLRPGTYNLVRRDMRLLDALALAGGFSQSEIPYLYVIRQAPPQKQSEIKDGAVRPASMKTIKRLPETAPVVPTNKKKEIDNLLGTVSRPIRPLNGGMTHFGEAGGGLSDAPVLLTAETAQDGVPATTPANDGQLRWVYRNGEWVKISASEAAGSQPSSLPSQPVSPVRPPVTQSQPMSRPMSRPVTRRPDDPFGWNQMAMQDMVRVIAINVKKLEQGDYRMNIVIRENDIIQVPPIQMGEFYIMGEVLRPGVYSLTGRKVTIKMALAASGNLGPLAWPENSILIRRVGKNQEQTIPINIERILRGKDPDVYLRKDDVVAIGTAWQCSFMAVIRNAFRMTYGFGFIYDRNFADPILDNQGYEWQARFTRW